MHCTHSHIHIHRSLLPHIPYTQLPLLKCLPATIIDVPLKLTANEALNTMAEPQIAQHGIIPFLMEIKQPSVTETEIHLAVLVDVGRVAERS